MLVYIHVPFCRSRCNYCAFHSIPMAGLEMDSKSGMLRDYMDTLLLELAHHADQLGGQTIHSVFFGGGTPSLLPPRAIGTIMERLARHFKISPKAEITLEANPESLRSPDVIADFLGSGVNRLSIGVQSMDDATLRTLGRPHKAQDSLNAVFAAREAGFANISIDLMWGLPGQGMRQWMLTLKDAVRLGPDHISAYGLTLEPGTALERQCEAGTIALPPERDQSIMFMEGSAFLEANGFLQYEISNFARMGFQCRHNTGYWEGSEYLGLGPSATSTIASRRWTNPASLQVWAEKTRNGSIGREAEILTRKTRVLELIMLRLRTARGLKLKAYRDLTGRDFLRENQRLVQAMHENGIIRIRNGYLSLTKSGMLVSNTVISNLFERVSKSFDEGRPARAGQGMKAAGNARHAEDSAPHAAPIIWPTA